MQIVQMLATGILAGILSGMFGVGGGIIIVPLLMLAFGMPQLHATATSLVALLLPVGLFGVLEYYRSGKIPPENIRLGLFIAAGLFAGAFFGAKIALYLPGRILQKTFAVFLGIVALRLWFK
ncbi:MAG: sulfite exporter TauE/SafE family protein [Chlorobiaceae bacterium]|nr:sulfite exporter TauE/SafE family protein [Chlorobiaceae bacterium]NTV60178.1 sulfite exporter TauE/SafE family protein [Chlorobiaceae bacterium]